MRIHTFSIVLVLISLTVFGQTQTKSDKELVESLIQESFDTIWSGLDKNKISKYYTNNFLLLENGEIWNNDSIVLYIEKSKAKKPLKRVNSFKFISATVTGKTAWVAYKNEAILYDKNRIVKKLKWLESTFAILTKEGWKLQLLHSSPISTKTTNKKKVK